MSGAVELLQALIRNACVNDGTPESGHEWRSVETLVDFFGQAGTVFEPAPGRTSMVWRVPGRMGASAPALMLMGHTDVVPVNEAGWTRDPFEAEIADGFIWGRGAVDMLNLVASMATAFAPYLAGDCQPPDGDLVFLAVADEEAAGSLGAGPLVSDHWDLVRCDSLLTEIAYPPIEIRGEVGYPVAVGEKGPHWTVLRTEGTPGHGSVPYGSDNALAPLVEGLAGIFASPSPVAVTDDWRAQLAALRLDEDLAEALADPARVDAAIDRIAVDDPRWAAYIHACTHMTVSPNVLIGGVKANVVPDRSEAHIDIRTLPGQSRTDVDRHLAEAMGRAGDRISIEPTADHPANASDRTDRLWATVVDAIEDETGSRNVVPTMMPATTDARFFRAKGIPAYGVGMFDRRVTFPDFLTMFHGNDERVSVDSIDATVRLFSTLLNRWSQPR